MNGQAHLLLRGRWPSLVAPRLGHATELTSGDSSRGSQGQVELEVELQLEAQPKLHGNSTAMRLSARLELVQEASRQAGWCSGTR